MFTLVFPGDLRQFKGNPFKTETPFGVPVSAGVRDALDERSELLEALIAASHALKSYAYGNASPDLATNIAAIADAAIAKAEGRS